MIPFDDAKTYDEEEARDLRTFAATYQTVRGALQASRTGREQKTYQKYVSKGKGKGKRPPRTFRKGQPPVKKQPQKSTPFKDKAGGKPSRGTWSKI